MPGRDQRGPLGLGPMTGRRSGICGQYPEYTFRRSGQGRGCGFGFGFRGGNRSIAGNQYRYRNTIPNERFASNIPNEIEEKDILREEAKALEESLLKIKKRIRDLS